MNKQHIQFCNGCGKILDEIQPADPPKQWVEARSFLIKYGFTWDDLSLLENFCPECQRVVATIKPSISLRTDSEAIP